MVVVGNVRCRVNTNSTQTVKRVALSELQSSKAHLIDVDRFSWVDGP